MLILPIVLFYGSLEMVGGHEHKQKLANPCEAAVGTPVPST